MQPQPITAQTHQLLDELLEAKLGKVPARDFAQLFIKFRKSIAIEDAELETLLGVGERTRRRYESGESTPPLSTLHHWRERFGVPTTLTPGASAKARRGAPKSPVFLTTPDLLLKVREARTVCLSSSRISISGADWETAPDIFAEQLKYDSEFTLTCLCVTEAPDIQPDLLKNQAKKDTTASLMAWDQVKRDLDQLKKLILARAGDCSPSAEGRLLVRPLLPSSAMPHGLSEAPIALFTIEYSERWEKTHQRAVDLFVAVPAMIAGATSAEPDRQCWIQVSAAWARDYWEHLLRPRLKLKPRSSALSLQTPSTQPAPNHD